MRYAVFADIHGNWEALEAAREGAESRRLSRFMILGDSIGYGANPNECLEWALENAALHVLGNHEAAILCPELRNEFSGWAREAIDWTAARLKPALATKLRDLPYLQLDGDIALAHGTLHRSEEFFYLLSEFDAYRSFAAVRSRVSFFGHTHVPAFFTEGARTGGRLSEGVLQLEKGERYLLNPGSIGQPRDRDPRLSFGIYDTNKLTFEIVRLTYHNRKAAKKIRAQGLPPMLADRLL